MTDLGISKRPRIVSPTRHRRFSHFLGGECGMEIAFLLLLTVPLTAASPLRATQSSEADIVHSEGVGRSEDRQEQHVPQVKIVPFHSEDKQLELDALKHGMAAKPRTSRALQRGCQLGTCQLHNLANTLYHISKTSGKEESKKASDPQGFGR